MGDFIQELWAFMKERKKFWLLPIILVLVLLGSLIVLTQGSAVPRLSTHCSNCSANAKAYSAMRSPFLRG